MNRKPLAELIPLLAKSIGSTSAVATGLLAPVALGASGDLDPEFADLGRLGPIAELKGPARSLEALDDEGLLLGGGYLECVLPLVLLLVRPRVRGVELRRRADGGRRDRWLLSRDGDFRRRSLRYRAAGGRQSRRRRPKGWQEPNRTKQPCRIPSRCRGPARHGLRKQRNLRAGPRALRIPQPGELGARGSGRAHRHRGCQGRVSHRLAPGCSRSARRVVRFRRHSHRARARLLSREPYRAHRFGRLPRHDD